jgi:hypothetical protein
LKIKFGKGGMKGAYEAGNPRLGRAGETRNASLGEKIRLGVYFSGF